METLRQGEATVKAALAGGPTRRRWSEALAATELAVQTAIDGARQGGRGLPGNPADAGLSQSEADVLRHPPAGAVDALIVSTPILAVALVVGLAIGLCRR